MYHIATHNIGFDYFMVIINKTVGILTQQSITGKWLAISKNLISLMELLKVMRIFENVISISFSLE